MRKAGGSALYEEAIGIGVAGNFAGHLEQAGEASDFVDVEVADPEAPKGVFPFYVPGGGEHFLHTYPVSDSEIRLGSDDEKHQIEPEVALLCELGYDEGGRVSSITPLRAMAHNDCSIRREGAKKISEKKNWGPASKGTARSFVELDGLREGGALRTYRLGCWLRRGDELLEYGVDSPVESYSYFGQRLLDWLVDRLREQRDGGPLEDLSRWIEVAGRPARALISIGATRYTDLGECTFLERGDEVLVAVYDAERISKDALRELLGDPAASLPRGISLLRQRVV